MHPPPQLRQLLGNIKLVGWMQPGVKNYQAHFRPFVRQLAKHQPGKTPMKVRIVRLWYETYLNAFRFRDFVVMGRSSMRILSK